MTSFEDIKQVLTLSTHPPVFGGLTHEKNNFCCIFNIFILMVEETPMKTRFSILLVVLSFLIISGCNNNGNNNISEELRLLINDIVKCTMLEKQLPGLAVSVVKNGNVIYQDSFGKTNIASGDDVEIDTPFAIASMTKIFTTFSVFQLIEDGLATLDDPIGMHLPNLPNEQWKTRTIRDLLSMSSGISVLGFCPDGPKKGEVC